MAIIKIVNNPCDTNTALQNLCSYIIQHNKTHGLFGGRGLNPENAYDNMCEAQELWLKASGRRAYHMVLGFDSSEPVASYDALQIAFEVSSIFFPAYQVLYGIHTDQPHLHIHFAINTVSLQDGHKLHLDYSTISHLQHQIDTIIADYIK